MCVGLSARVVRREISAQLLDDLVPGDYVMVHAGAAIAKITQEDDEESEDVLGSLF